MAIPNEIGHAVTPHFLIETDFINNELHNVQIWTKPEREKLKKNEDFCPRDMSTRHRILPSCDCKVREIMVTKFELVP